MKVVGLICAFVVSAGLGYAAFYYVQGGPPQGNVRANVATALNGKVNRPQIARSAYVHPLASVIGHVSVGEKVFIAPGASIRSEAGQAIYIGRESNVQDGCVVRALERQAEGEAIEKNVVTVGDRQFAVYVGKRVSLAPQTQVHGPASVGDDTFIGMQALVFKAQVGEGCVVEPGAKVMGVKVPSRRYVPAGRVVNSQAQADRLPRIEVEYPFKLFNESVVRANTALADGYNGKAEAREERANDQ